MTTLRRMLDAGSGGKKFMMYFCFCTEKKTTHIIKTLYFHSQTYYSHYDTVNTFIFIEKGGFLYDWPSLLSDKCSSRNPNIITEDREICDYLVTTSSFNNTSSSGSSSEHHGDK